MSKLTVLMTVFNGAKYLPDTLRSLLKQTYSDFELLIVNDASSDATLKVIRSFKDDRIRVITNQVNCGQTKSLNIGLHNAQGRWIARMDADDLAFPGWLEKQISFINENPHYAVVSCQAVIINGQGKIKKPLKPPQDIRDIVLRSLVASPINHVGCLMQKKIIQEVGGYNEKFRIAADFELWSELVRRGFLITTRPEWGVAIRVHEQSQSVMARGQRDLEEMSQIMHQNILRLTTAPCSLETAKLLWKCVYAVENLSAVEFKEGKDFLRRIYQNVRPEWGIEVERAQRVSRKTLKTMDVKRLFALISRKELPAVRQLAREHQKEFGSGKLFQTVFYLSFLGSFCLGALPLAYEMGLKMSTRFKLMKSSFPGLNAAR